MKPTVFVTRSRDSFPSEEKECLESEAAYYGDSQHCSKTLEVDRSVTHKEINQKHASPKEWRDGSTIIWSGTSANQLLSERRSHPSNVTIVRISASNQHSGPVAMCT